MEHRSKPSLWALVVAFTNIGLTSVGGAASPLRYVLVRQRKWLSESDFAEIFGIAQALPGATGINMAVMAGDRFAGALGPLAALAGLCVPSLLLAIALANSATNLAATNARFASALACVTAAVAGLFIANGLRLARLLLREHGQPMFWRAAQPAIIAAGVGLVALLRVSVPVALIGLVGVSFAVEWRARARAATGAEP